MQIRIGRLLIMLFLATPTLAAFAQQRDQPPNVILMMADDLAFSDLACYGSKSLRTPTLDKLAGDGVRLTSFYAGCTICTLGGPAGGQRDKPKRPKWLK